MLPNGGLFAKDWVVAGSVGGWALVGLADSKDFTSSHADGK
jgi:hypothetical protein